MLKSGALCIWRWHGPVSVEWSACDEECDFGCEPAYSDVDGEVEDHFLDFMTEGKARVHD